jgi:hypothetical protein
VIRQVPNLQALLIKTREQPQQLTGMPQLQMEQPLEQEEQEVLAVVEPIMHRQKHPNHNRETNRHIIIKLLRMVDLKGRIILLRPLGIIKLVSIIRKYPLILIM